MRAAPKISTRPHARPFRCYAHERPVGAYLCLGGSSGSVASGTTANLGVLRLESARVRLALAEAHDSGGHS